MYVAGINGGLPSSRCAGLKLAQNSLTAKIYCTGCPRNNYLPVFAVLFYLISLCGIPHQSQQMISRTFFQETLAGLWGPKRT